LPAWPWIFDTRPLVMSSTIAVLVTHNDSNLQTNDHWASQHGQDKQRPDSDIHTSSHDWIAA
jgi:hypothetical protein